MKYLLRRYTGRVSLETGLFPEGAFLCRENREPPENSISFTGCPEMWLTSDVELYQSKKALPSGDLPSIIELDVSDLPDLQVTQEKDEDDVLYGEFHCGLACPCQSDRQKLASAASAHFRRTKRFWPRKRN